MRLTTGSMRSRSASFMDLSRYALENSFAGPINKVDDEQ
jgi:hypothetical protein